MAPTIEKAIIEINDRLQGERARTLVEADRSQLKALKVKVRVRMEDIIRINKQEHKKSESPEKVIRETFRIAEMEGVGSLYLKTFKIVEKKTRFKKSEKTCSLGFTTGYNEFKAMFPYLCKDFSPKENNPRQQYMWNFLDEKDIESWNPFEGNIQVLTKDVVDPNREDDQVIMAVEFDRKSLIGREILRMNKERGLFKESNTEAN